MALTTKGLATRSRIIEGAAEHLRGDDPGEITLDDIRAITGTSKGQLFHYFPGGKDEMLLAVVRHESDRVLQDQQPYLGNLTTWSSWQRWRDTVIARYRAQGTRCPLNALMRQVTNTPGAADVVAELMARWQAELAAGVTSMQAAGSFRRDLRAEAAASALLAGIQGGVQLLRITGTIDHLEAGLDVVLAHLREVA